MGLGVSNQQLAGWRQTRYQLSQDLIRTRAQVALPNHRYFEASFLERGDGGGVPLAVGSEFLPPELSIPLRERGGRTSAVVMPKTTVNEDRPTSRSVGNVRSPWEVAVFDSEAMAGAVESGSDERLRRS